MAHLTCCVWTLCVAGYAASVSAEDIVGYRFLSWPEPLEIDTSEASFSTRSRIDCARGCRKYEHCLSFSFDPVTRTCFISPAATTKLSSSKTPSAHKHRIFEMTPALVEMSMSLPVETPESRLQRHSRVEKKWAGRRRGRLSPCRLWWWRPCSGSD